MDSSILIRCISAGANYLAAAAGGGIVYDSCPLSEYEELCTKLYPIIHPHAFPKVADTCDQHQRCLLPHDHTAT
jgi:anthranilate/para-aminobenzoate synthase component I